MQVTSSDQLTGRFNSHLRDVIVLFADEALKPYDKDGESRLKGLITEPRLAYEGKGQDVQTGKNRLHVIMASNEDWLIPTNLDEERRFMLCLANRKRAGQHAWFGKLNDELERGGYSALLWDLLQRGIGDWAPRSRVPMTRGLIDQKLRGMDPLQQWWFNALLAGDPPFETSGEDDCWALEPVRGFRQDAKDSYFAHCRENGIRSPGSWGKGNDMFFWQGMKKLIPNMRPKLAVAVPDDRPDVKTSADGRAPACELPPLGQCRQTFEALLGANVDWEE